MPSQTHEVWLKSNMAQSHAGQMQVKKHIIWYDKAGSMTLDCPDLLILEKV